MNEIKVYICSLKDGGNCESSFYGYLSSDEQLRAKLFSNPTRRRRYVLSHFYLRLALSQQLATPIECIEFGVEKMGRPIISNIKKSVNFNLSHSEDVAVIGISADNLIGIDVEHVKAGLSKRVSGMVLNINESYNLSRISSRFMDNYFLQYWVAKEAFLKLNGVGFYLNPKLVSIDPLFNVAGCKGSSLTVELARLNWIDIGDSARCVLANPDGKESRILVENLGW